MSEKKWEEARQAFIKRGHKATLIMDNGRYTAIDWKPEGDSYDYYINFIVDKMMGTLFITGDLGDCIATWFNPATAQDIAKYVHNIRYFISKMQTSSDKYTCDEDDVATDIRSAIEDHWTGAGESLAEKYPEFDDYEWEEFRESIPESIHRGAFYPDSQQCEFLDKYYPEWWDGSRVTTAGQKISPRVYLWAQGFQMAVKQLQEQGLLEKEEAN